ncbi:MAG: TolC family protein [Planctomycetota bacterium]|nr:MAG: TolC family protein [Planctomycetota bacterium]
MLTALVLGLLAPVLQDPAEPAAEPSEPAAETLPLRLEDVVRLVAGNAPALLQARLQARSAAAGVEEASGVFDPVFFGDLTYSYRETPTSGGLFSGGLPTQHVRSWQAEQGLRSTLISGGTVQVAVSETYSEDNLPPSFFGFNPESNIGLNFNLTQPLLRGGWRLNAEYSRRSAELGADQAGAAVRRAEVDTLQAAVDAYWDLAFAIEDVKVKEFSLDLARELREVTLARFRVGSAAEVEVVQTEADIATRTEALLTARNRVAQVQDRLRLLLFPFDDQKDWRVEIVPVSEPPEPTPAAIDWEEAYRTALEHRPDLLQLETDVEQKRLDWEVARRNRLPRLDLIATGTSAAISRQVADAWSTVSGFYYAGYSIGLSFELPFGNRQAAGAELRTRHAYELAQRTLRDQRNQVAGEVREAVRNLNYQAERIEATALASRVARRQLDAEQRRLREGASTNFQVLQFQRDLEAALSAEKNARMEYAKALVRLRTVQGLDWAPAAEAPPPAEAGS